LAESDGALDNDDVDDDDDDRNENEEVDDDDEAVEFIGETSMSQNDLTMLKGGNNMN
jgi:hypothetical protein